MRERLVLLYQYQWRLCFIEFRRLECGWVGQTKNLPEWLTDRMTNFDIMLAYLQGPMSGKKVTCHQ